MRRITSFEVDHNKLEKGLYISRVDGDVTTYDVRMTKPNVDTPMSTGTIHAIEHIGATYLRNSDWQDRIIYFGPMGCRTGFYLLIRNSDNNRIISLVKETFLYISDFKGDIPGASAVECGNYLDMDKDGAVNMAKEYLKVLKNYTADRLKY